MQLLQRNLNYGETERHLFAIASKHLSLTLLTGKRVKNPKKSAIIDHTLLHGQDTHSLERKQQIKNTSQRIVFD